MKNTEDSPRHLQHDEKQLQSHPASSNYDLDFFEPLDKWATAKAGIQACVDEIKDAVSKLCTQQQVVKQDVLAQVESAIKGLGDHMIEFMSVKAVKQDKYAGMGYKFMAEALNNTLAPPMKKLEGHDSSQADSVHRLVAAVITNAKKNFDNRGSHETQLQSIARNMSNPYTL